MGNQHNTGQQVSITPTSPSLITCRVDGSWAFGWIGGIGFLFLKENTLIAYKSERVQACCPLQAEAIALVQGLNYAISIGLSECAFITDNKTLAEACSNLNPPIEVDWRAHGEIFDAWKKMRCNKGFTCLHEGRSTNGMTDYLAKRGRLTGDSYLGFTYPIFSYTPVFPSYQL